MNKEELTEKAQELTIKNVTNGKSKYYSWGFHNGCVVGLEYNNNRIADLEKENAERKAEIENDRDLPAIAYMQGAEKQKRKDEEQLTKAKKIIKELCGMVRELNKPNVQLTNVDYSLSEAEQFIKDSEVEK